MRTHPLRSSSCTPEKILIITLLFKGAAMCCNMLSKMTFNSYSHWQLPWIPHTWCAPNRWCTYAHSATLSIWMVLRALRHISHVEERKTLRACTHRGGRQLSAIRATTDRTLRSKKFTDDDLLSTHVVTFLISVVSSTQQCPFDMEWRNSQHVNFHLKRC